MTALSVALNSKQVDVVLKSRDDLEHIKLRAKQVRDRALLADATEFQMRVERWLGELLEVAQNAGHLCKRGGGRSKCAPPTLKDLGIDAKLSMKAKCAASLDEDSFAATISDMRARIASAKAKPVSDIGHVDRNIRRRSREADRSVFSVLLADGTTIGGHRIGTLRSLAQRFERDHLRLQKIIEHVGNEADQLATVRDMLSAEVLNDIISAT